MTELIAKDITSRELPERARLFPLPDHVLLPGLPSPYRVFEPRYRQLVTDLKELPAEDRWIAMPRLAPGWQKDYEGAPELERVTTIGLVIEMSVDEEGLDLLTVLGVKRVKIQELPSDRLYRVARVTPYPDLAPVDGSEITRRFETVFQLVSSLGPYIDSSSKVLVEAIAPTSDISRAVYQLGSLFLPDPDWRQRFLETRRIHQRLALLEEVLAATLALAHQIVEDDALPS
jgi:Lon protease-like protein